MKITQLFLIAWLLGGERERERVEILQGEDIRSSINYKSRKMEQLIMKIS